MSLPVAIHKGVMELLPGRPKDQIGVILTLLIDDPANIQCGQRWGDAEIQAIAKYIDSNFDEILASPEYAATKAEAKQSGDSKARP